MKHEITYTQTSRRRSSGKTSTRVDFFEFDSICEYASYVDSNLPQESDTRTYGDNRNKGQGSSWSWQSWDDAMKSAQNGNREYVQNLFDRLEIMEGSVMGNAFEEIRDVAGEYFDVGDVLSGEPECFRRMEAREVKPVIPVYVNFTQSVSASADDIMNRGTAIVAMCDTLEKEGYRVELNIICAVRYIDILGGNKTIEENVGKSHRILFKVDMSNDPLDMDGISFALINPSFFRRLFFGLMGLVSGYNGNVGAYYAIDEFEGDDMDLIGYEKDSGGIYFGSDWIVTDSRRFKDIEAAKKHVLGVVEKYKESPEKLTRV